MNTTRVTIIGLIVCLLAVAMFSTSSPPTRAGYAQLTLNFNCSGSALGTNTNLIRAVIIDNNNVEYEYTGTGQTVVNIPENSILERIDVWVTIDDNYAESTPEAISRTRVGGTLTDPDSVVQFDNYIGQGSITQAWAFDNGSYYTVNWREDSVVETPTRLDITLTTGTWDLDLNYEVYAIVTS